MKWGSFVNLVIIPRVDPMSAVRRIVRGFSIIGKWNSVSNWNINPPNQGKIMSLRLPITIDPIIPTKIAWSMFLLYM